MEYQQIDQSPKKINLQILIISLYIGFFISALGETLSGPIFPEEAKNKGVEVSMVGIIMGIHPFFSIMISLWLGKIMKNKGRKIILLIGSFIQSFGYIVMALIFYLDNKILFIIGAIFGRVLSGVGVTLYLTPSYALVSILYKSTCQMKYSYLEMFTGMGLFLGYLQGSLLYQIGGYTLPFYINALFVSSIIPLTLLFIPSNHQITLTLKLKEVNNEKILNNNINNSSNSNSSKCNNDSNINKSNNNNNFQSPSQEYEDLMKQQLLYQKDNDDLINKTKLESSSNSFQFHMTKEIIKSFHGVEEEKKEFIKSIIQSRVENQTEYIHNSDSPNSETVLKEDKINSFLQIQNERFSYWILAKDSRITLTFISEALPSMAILFLQPTYALYLQDYLDIGSEYSGYFFAFGGISYMLFAIVYGKLQQCISKRILFGSGIFFCAITYLFQGPATWTGLKPSLYQNLFVRFVNGMGSGGVFIVTMPFLMEILTDILPIFSNEKLGDIASALYMTSWHAGEILGPIAGGIMTQNFGFIQTSTIFFYILSFIALLHTIRYTCYENYLQRQMLKTSSNFTTTRSEEN